MKDSIYIHTYVAGDESDESDERTVTEVFSSDRTNHNRLEPTVPSQAGLTGSLPGIVLKKSGNVGPSAWSDSSNLHTQITQSESQ